MQIFSNAFLWIEGKWTHFPQSILVDSGRISEIFEPRQALPANTSIHDLKGHYLYPGFTDTHTHSFEGGLYSLGADLSACGDIAEVLAKLDAAYQKADKEDIIFAWQLDENQLTEQRFPTLEELDAVIPNRALILRRIDGHSCVLNSFARALIPELETQNHILRGKENDKAVHFFHQRLNPETILQAYQAAAQHAMQGGFTGLHTMIGDADYSITHYQLLRDNLDKFPITFTLYPQSFNLRAALDAGATRIGGCILADGSIGSGTAALSKPYLDGVNRGVLYQSDAFWHTFIAETTQHDLQVAVHAIGDRAIRQINSVYLSLPETAALRHQLIHCEITDDQLIAEIARSGAATVMQPNFDLLWGGRDGFYARKLGIERSLIMNRFKALTRSGIKVCGGSDWYITALDAALSIRAAMNHHNPLESLSHPEAIDIYTRNAAWLSHEEETRGKLAKGYTADFTIYDQPLDCPTAEPELTCVVCKGEICHGE